MMRIAACHCGAVTARCTGEPVRVSVCHCLACQRRSGSAFAVQARFPDTAVEIAGETRLFDRMGDGGSRITIRFCTVCGSTIAYTLDTQPALTAIPVGAFADPAFPAPAFSVYEGRMPAWLHLDAPGMEHWR